MQNILAKVMRLSWGALFFQLLVLAGGVFGSVMGSAALKTSNEKVGLLALTMLVVIGVIFVIAQIMGKVTTLTSIADLSFKKRAPALDAAVKALSNSMLVSVLVPAVSLLLVWTNLIAETPMVSKWCFVGCFVLGIAASAMMLVAKEEVDSHRSALTSLTVVTGESAKEVDLSRFDKKPKAADADADAGDDETGRAKRYEL